jgi:hypothetical protein
MHAAMSPDGDLSLGIQYPHGHDFSRKACYRFVKPCYTGLVRLAVNDTRLEFGKRL